ncbi:hypothetical protein GGI12_003378 [Dipsacomyces acuminosporus]|nr:hypothetical protein GGI12_003378 [Dipsacomyces acuminosporus]
MKFTVAAVAAFAAVASAANENAIAQISAHWADLAAVISKDLPLIKAGNPELYNAATSVLGGSTIPAAFDINLVQKVATGIPAGIMNPVLVKAGITGVTLDGKPLPTGAASGTAPASTPAPTSASSPASKSGSAPATGSDTAPKATKSGSEAATKSGSETAPKATKSGSEAATEPASELGSVADTAAGDASSAPSTKATTSSKNGAAAVAGSLGAVAVAVAALF